MAAAKQLKSSDAPPVRVIQITDSHLFADPEARLVGLKCQESFDEVLALVRRHETAVDCVLCTGDIAQDASEEAYRRFHVAIGELGAPQLWNLGNHDREDSVLKALGEGNPCLRKNQVFGEWQIIMLNTNLVGEVHGHLTEAELAFLDARLQEAERAGRHSLVALHHNPLPVAAAWLQKHCLRNPEAFFAVTDRFSGVRGVLWGHIHQEYDDTRKGVRMLASPSTCIQFHPENDEFQLDHQNPGYRWLDLCGDGSIESGIQRVTGRTFAVDFNSSGY